MFGRQAPKRWWEPWALLVGYGSRRLPRQPVRQWESWQWRQQAPPWPVNWWNLRLSQWSSTWWGEGRGTSSCSATSPCATATQRQSTAPLQWTCPRQRRLTRSWWSKTACSRPRQNRRPNGWARGPCDWPRTGASWSGGLSRSSKCWLAPAWHINIYVYINIYIYISMSEAPVLVPIFPYAAEGGARPSSYFRQTSWESETNCLKIFDEKIAPQANFMKQIAQKARFFGLNPDVYKIFLIKSWTNSMSVRERWNKVRALRNHSETRWNEVRALRNHSEEGVGCRQPTEWTVK